MFWFLHLFSFSAFVGFILLFIFILGFFCSFGWSFVFSFVLLFCLFLCFCFFGFVFTIILGMFVSFLIIFFCYGLPWWLSVKESACNAEGSGLILSWKDLLERAMAIYSSIVALKIPRTEEPCDLQSMGCGELVHLLLLIFLFVFAICLWFCLSVYFVCFLHSTVCRILVLWPEVGPEPLWWECWVKYAGPPVNSQAQWLLIIIISQGF